MFSASLYPSKILAAWIVFWGALVLIPVWFSALPGWFCMAIDAGVLVWVVVSLQNYYFVGNRQLSCNDGCWTIVQHNRAIPIELDGEFYLSRWLIVLIARSDENKKIVLVILPDSMDADAMRRLRVLLKQLPVLEGESEGTS